MAGEITLLLQKIVEAPDAAMHGLWEHFFERLVRQASREIARKPQRAKDEEDVAIEAMNSFFNGLKRGKFDEIQSRTDLWQVLVVITARKATRAYRDERTQKRGGGKVLGESVLRKHSSEGAGRLEHVAAVEPDQFVDLVFSEMLERLTELGDGTLRIVAKRKLEGFTIAEIAEELNVVPRTIDRKIQRIKSIWESDLK